MISGDNITFLHVILHRWNLLCVFLNLVDCTNETKSFSKSINSGISGRTVMIKVISLFGTFLKLSYGGGIPVEKKLSSRFRIFTYFSCVPVFVVWECSFLYKQ